MGHVARLSVCVLYYKNKHNFQFITSSHVTSNKVAFLLKTKYRSHGEGGLNGELNTPVT